MQAVLTLNGMEPLTRTLDPASRSFTVRRIWTVISSPVHFGLGSIIPMALSSEVRQRPQGLSSAPRGPWFS